MADRHHSAAGSRAAATRHEVKTLAKGLQILDLLVEQGEVRTGEAARILGIDKGGASRLLQTLVQAGYAEAGEGRGFRPGRKISGRRGGARPLSSLREKARPFLVELAQVTGETAHLAIPADEHVLYLDAVDTPLPLRVDRPAGTLSPAYCTALGKVMLAFTNMPIPHEMRSPVTGALMEPNAFIAMLKEIAANRYALDDEEYHIGIRCAAAPLFDESGALIAAIGVSGPTARIDHKRLGELGLLVRDLGARFRR